MNEFKHPGGRPTDYKPEYCAKLLEHMSQGYSFESFAAVVDVTLSTIYLWTRNYSEFSEAKRAGQVKSRLFWERAGRMGLFKKKNDPELNTTLWIFNMKNRFHWSDSPGPEDDDREESYSEPKNAR